MRSSSRVFNPLPPKPSLGSYPGPHLPQPSRARQGSLTGSEDASLSLSFQTWTIPDSTHVIRVLQAEAEDRVRLKKKKKNVKVFSGPQSTHPQIHINKAFSFQVNYLISSMRGGVTSFGSKENEALRNDKICPHN